MDSSYPAGYLAATAAFLSAADLADPVVTVPRPRPAPRPCVPCRPVLRSVAPRSRVFGWVALVLVASVAPMAGLLASTWH